MNRRRRANPVIIGAFVLGAVVLGTSIVVVWGSGRLFRHTVTFVAYFSGSVNGLNLGAPVKFHGAQIGSVTQIRSRLAQAATMRPEEFRIPVWFDIDLQELSELGGRPIELDRARLDGLISQGLRAQLQLESFVTGVLYLSLDFFPGSPAVLVRADRPDILEIPTVPTAFERASEVITKFMTQIEKVDIDAAVHSITAAVDGVNGLIRSPEVNRAVTAAREALESIRRLSDAAGPHIQPMMRSVEATSADARDSLHHLDAVLADLQTQIDTQGPLSVELTRTITDLGDAARSVRDLADYLERNPNAFLVGRPGP
ncbi:MAG TPA: MlaD family protein [Candidatus Binatia bacterium]|nr:MlaD family protein [Candidatus Binatia bacterium]